MNHCDQKFQRCTSCVTDTLVPVLKRIDTVILHNLPSHKVAGEREAIEAAGARLLYRPFYSLEFHPIKQAFAKLKALLRTAARTVPDLRDVVRETVKAFRPHECRNYLAAAGYDAFGLNATGTGSRGAIGFTRPEQISDRKRRVTESCRTASGERLD